MTHDPMCPCASHTHAPPGCLLCRCDLIARVRADERAKARERVEALPTFGGPYSGLTVSRTRAAAAAGGES